MSALTREPVEATERVSVQSEGAGVAVLTVEATDARTAAVIVHEDCPEVEADMGMHVKREASPHGHEVWMLVDDAMVRI